MMSCVVNQHLTTCSPVQAQDRFAGLNMEPSIRSLVISPNGTIWTQRADWYDYIAIQTDSGNIIQWYWNCVLQPRAFSPDLDAGAISEVEEA